MLGEEEESQSYNTIKFDKRTNHDKTRSQNIFLFLHTIKGCHDKSNRHNIKLVHE